MNMIKKMNIKMDKKLNEGVKVLEITEEYIIKCQMK